MQFLCLYNLISLSITLSFAGLPSVIAQDARHNILTDEVDAFINQLLIKWNSPGGVAVAVVHIDDQGKWNMETKGYGIATLNGTKVTPDTRFSIGSNSKLFDTLATGLLINNETLSPRLSWSTKIASILPTWGLEDRIATAQATIIDVMSHRTGLPRHDFHYKWSDHVPDIIRKMRSLRPSAEFRDVWQYDNSMYMLLSYLPTALLPSKIPFARYVKQHIFDPLGMTSTTYSFDVANASGKLADGMTKQGVKIRENIFGNGTVRALPYWSTLGGEDGNVLSGPGGVISNAIDMATWLQTLLLSGVKPGTNQSVIPASAIEAVSNGIMVVNGAAGFPEFSLQVYGGGQWRFTYRGHEIIEHGGDSPGFHSAISRIPSDNIGVAVLTNDDIYGTFMKDVIKYRLLDAALGLDPIDWTSRYENIIPLFTPPLATPRPPKASLPAVSLMDIAGKYRNDGYGDAELCFVSSVGRKASPSCAALVANMSILPGVVDSSIPTFISEWDSPWASHLKFAHFNGNTFNVTALQSIPTGNPSDPYWVNTADNVSYTGTLAEVVVERGRVGFGLTGLWGAGDGISGPQGNTTFERSEVWFDKI